MRFSLRSLAGIAAIICLASSSVRGADIDPKAEPGLVAEYFSLPAAPTGFDDFKPGLKPTLVRIDKNVDFESAEAEFFATKLVDSFLARWTGILRVEKAGTYTIAATSDDGSRVFINEKLVVENGGIHAMIEKEGQVELTAGDHAVRIEFVEVAGGAGCKIAWATAGGSKIPIPASAFFHKAGTEKIEFDRAAWEKLAGGKAPAKAAGRKKTDAKAAEMDYGPFLSTTLGVGLSSNIAFKGIIVTLNKEKKAYLCFDTEMMRVSAAWIGDGLSLAGRPFAGDSNDYPIVEGPVVFETQVRPGWANGEKLDDPRPPADLKLPKDGPLPAEWAKYRGLYRNGDKVVLSYTVGDAEVLEMPGVTKFGKTELAFYRDFTVSPSRKPLALLVLEPTGKPGEEPKWVYGAPGWGMSPFKPSPAHMAYSVGLPTPDGQMLATCNGLEAGALWEVQGGRLYLRLPASEKPVNFRVTIGKMLHGDEPGPWVSVCNSPPQNPVGYINGGPALWTEPVTTKGTLSTDTIAPYVIDTLTAPETNPYKSWLRFTAMDFFKDGRAAVTTWNGDVWVVGGIDEKLENLTWKRYATGLAGPMGLKIVDDVVYVNSRDQITRLKDLNNDGEADFYENFNNDCFLTPNFHEYCFDLQTDAAGDFYFAKGSAIWAGSLRMTAHAGTFIKVSKDGSKLEVLASGLRAPNGIAVGPNGELTCSDNQGNWTPLCPINFIKKGSYYGWVGKDEKAPETREKPLCWIPYNFDKSTSGQLWVDSDKWGPFKGRLIATSYDCSVSRIFMDKVGDDVQGGVVKFPWAFPSGLMRGKFHPTDGQLYVCGLRGWSSRAARECVLQRVRYTGKPVHGILDAKVTKTGMDVTFTEALDPASATDLENVSAEWFNVVRSGNYGSGEIGVNDPKKKGREPVEIKSAKLSADGKTVSLEIPTLKPVTNLVLTFKVKAVDGTAVKQEMSYTINRMP